MKTKSKPTPTDITLIIDRSGSMGGQRDDVIGGINTFFDEQLKQPGEALVTLIQFDDVYEVNYALKPLTEVKHLTTSTYVPRGTTALYDALGRALTAISTEANNQVVVVMTDGAENASREFTQAAVKQLVEAAQARGVTVIFLGANIDSFQVGGSLGIRSANTVNYDATASGFAKAASTMSYATSNVRSGNWGVAGATQIDSDFTNLADYINSVNPTSK